MLVQPRLQVSLRSIIRSGIARIGRPRRVRSQVGWPRIHGPYVPLRSGLERLRSRSPTLRRNILPRLRLNVGSRLRLRKRTPRLRRIRPRLRLRVGPALKCRPRLVLRRTRLVFLRARLRLMLRLGMRLRSRAWGRRRRGPLRLVVLPDSLHRRHEQGSHRGSQSRAAPSLRPAYAFHIHPNSIDLSPEPTAPKHLTPLTPLVGVQIVICCIRRSRDVFQLVQQLRVIV